MSLLDPEEDRLHFDRIQKALKKRGLKIELENGWEVRGPYSREIYYRVYVGEAVWPNGEIGLVAIYPWGVWGIDDSEHWLKRDPERRITSGMKW